jgi:ATP-dependent RNA helicase DDX51/DBP6
VIDEADRLLNQKYHDWIDNVLKATSTSSPNRVWTRRSGPHAVRLQKLLFSATLDRNPGKIASLGLYDPTYICVSSDSSGRLFTVPEKLSERMIVIQETQQKPLVLINLLTAMKDSVSGVLVFTKSVESAHRLAALLNAYGISEGKGVYAHAFSSTLAPAERQKLLVGLSDGRVKCLICSDVMARGIDLGTVGLVVNYDVPTTVMGYIHRVGRTARAENDGVAVSLVTTDQVFTAAIYD